MPANIKQFNDTNFILAKIPDSAKIAGYLGRERKITVNICHFVRM